MSETLHEGHGTQLYAENPVSPGAYEDNRRRWQHFADTQGGTYREDLPDILHPHVERLLEAHGVTAPGPSEFAPTPAASKFQDVMDRFDRSTNLLRETYIRPREVIVCGGNQIENQEISIIDRRDDGFISANFKLTGEHYERVLAKLRTDVQQDDPDVSKGKIRYDSIDGSESFVVSKAYKLKKDGVTVKVATAEPIKTAVGSDRRRAALGLVTIDIPYSGQNKPTAEQMEDQINQLLIDELGVTEGLAPPSPEEFARYKESRYRWHHNLGDTELTPQQLQEIDHLESQEVFPAYHTMVLPGKHLEYEERYGRFAAYHSVMPKDIVPVIQNGGLMSTHERFRRGLVGGSSTSADFETGGADSVFTRIVVEGSGSESFKSNFEYGYAIILGPEVFDRTDWYAYHNDYDGATDFTKFPRLAPETFLKDEIEQGHTPFNEQMFRTGIPVDAFKGIACIDYLPDRQRLEEALGLDPDNMRSLWGGPLEGILDVCAEKQISNVDGKPIKDFILQANSRLGAVHELHATGIDTINGVPVEEFFSTVNSVEDYFAIAHGR